MEVESPNKEKLSEALKELNYSVNDTVNYTHTRIGKKKQQASTITFSKEEFDQHNIQYPKIHYILQSTNVRKLLIFAQQEDLVTPLKLTQQTDCSKNTNTKSVKSVDKSQTHLYF